MKKRARERLTAKHGGKNGRGKQGESWREGDRDMN